MPIQRVNPNELGFTAIYTPFNPPSSMAAPTKEPYIIFVSSTDKNEEKTKAYRAAIKPLSVLGLHEFQSENGKTTFVITITSHRKVLGAIDFFFQQQNEYPESSNKYLFAELEELRQLCETELKVKTKNPIPPLSVRPEQFKEILDSPFFEASHPVTRVEMNGKDYIYKQMVGGRIISELETANSRCAQLLLPHRHPKTFSVHNSEGKRLGVLSEEIKNFKPICEIVFNHPYINEEIFLKIIELWLLAYLEENTDLHLKNYGLNEASDGVMFDDDQATWPLTSKYTGRDPRVPYPNANGVYQIAPVETFPITQGDISNFPCVKDAKPYHWFNKHGLEDHIDENNISIWSKTENCQNTIYYMFLKRAVIPDNVYHAIAKSTISSPKKIKEFAEHKCKRTQKLKEELVKNKKFQYYLQTNPDVIKKLICEFEEYNADLSELEKKYLRIDLQAIQKNFAEIKMLAQTEAMNAYTAPLPYLANNKIAPKLPTLTKFISFINSPPPPEQNSPEQQKFVSTSKMLDISDTPPQSDQHSAIHNIDFSSVVMNNPSSVTTNPASFYYHSNLSSTLEDRFFDLNLSN